MNQASNSCEEKSSYLMPRCVLKKMPSKRYTTCGKDVQRAKKKTHTHTHTQQNMLFGLYCLSQEWELNNSHNYQFIIVAMKWKE